MRLCNRLSHPDLIWVAFLFYMKEQYIIKKSADLISAEFKSIEGMSLSVGDCLLIMDMQNFFTSSVSPAFIPSSTDIIESINHLINQFITADSCLIFTQHSNNEKNAGMMNVRFNHMLSHKSPLYRLDERLNITDAKTIIEKHQFDAFYKTELERILLILNIRRIFICGVMIERCIESTARSSFVRGFETYVISDASATKNLDLHNVSLISMEEAGIEIMNSGYFHA